MYICIYDVLNVFYMKYILLNICSPKWNSSKYVCHCSTRLEICWTTFYKKKISETFHIPDNHKHTTCHESMNDIMHNITSENHPLTNCCHWMKNASRSVKIRKPCISPDKTGIQRIKGHFIGWEPFQRVEISTRFFFSRCFEWYLI